MLALAHGNVDVYQPRYFTAASLGWVAPKLVVLSPWFWQVFMAKMMIRWPSTQRWVPATCRKGRGGAGWIKTFAQPASKGKSLSCWGGMLFVIDYNLRVFPFCDMSIDAWISQFLTVRGWFSFRKLGRSLAIWRTGGYLYFAIAFFQMAFKLFSTMDSSRNVGI